MAIKLAAMFGNEKAKLFVKGRKSWKYRINESLKNGDKPVWFHLASLGEYEQAKPLIELLYKKNDLVLTFFSPSGFEIKKDNPFTKKVFYLPIDSKKNAESLTKIIDPKIVIFTKYDLWYHYINYLDKNKIPVVVISARFLYNQIYFKLYGQFFFKILKKVSHFYVQNNESGQILEKSGIKNFTVAGDTRIDSVIQNTRHLTIDQNLLNAFATQYVLIVGSSYSPEENLIKKLIDEQVWQGKVIIAPHNISHIRIASIKELFAQKYTLYSQWDKDPNSLKQVLVIDNIGMLKQLYAISDIALIGGGFGKTIHNTLEPAAFGLPILFGPKFSKFTEAISMVKAGGAVSIGNYIEFKKQILKLSDPLYRHNSGALNKSFINDNKDATQKILKHLSKNFHLE